MKAEIPEISSRSVARRAAMRPTPAARLRGWPLPQLSGRAFAALLVALLVPLLWATVFALPAKAELSKIGPVDPDTGFPGWLEDAKGLRLGPCFDQDNCSAPAPDPTRPPSTPDNVGKRMIYWSARATTPTNSGGSASLTLSTQGNFSTSGPEDGAQQVFNRILVRVDNLVPGATYEVIHPYGTETFTNVDGGPRGIHFTEDVGCLQAPCEDFETASNGRVGPWLSWDNLGAATDGPPPGYIGVPSTPHRVSNSPMIDENGEQQNYFKVEGPDVGGPGIDTVKTDLFSVEGRISGPTAYASPRGGLYDTGRSVSLAASDPAAKIFYTTDGTEPDRNSTPYRKPLRITESTTLKFATFPPVGSSKERLRSPVLTETYTID